MSKKINKKQLAEGYDDNIVIREKIMTHKRRKYGEKSYAEEYQSRIRK